ncbi:MAG TPA: grasp-with-spasm system ATP-grasp peptide maturase [Bacteroidia bacterium]|jgi:ATP-GRASP peptide maturase of grasp-with-spasm system|nr:grasp-with-spasm system ATP-grasp peptide maturase [Bacteroidia bacterium]
MATIRRKSELSFIVILSSPEDQSTSDVIEWLIAKKEKVIRINHKKGIYINKISLNESTTNISFKYNNQIINSKNIKSFWYRRGFIKINNIKHSNLPSKIRGYLQEEKDAILVFFIYELDLKAKINSLMRYDINKLYQLAIARNCKLKIPNTIVTNDLKNVRYFLRKNKRIITKSIQSSFNLQNNEKTYGLMTNTYDSTDIQKSQKQFFITKFQKHIKKRFELRIFYLNKEFYPMAIFSQNNFKTRVDFRNYDMVKPNRTVPYLLPESLRNQLLLLMKKLGLSSGSIDMIVSDSNEYYFLEVNPVGQFGMVSFPCNYFIEEKIANILLQKTE